MVELHEKDAWRDKVTSILTFRYLDRPELDHLLKVATFLEYEEGEPIVHEGGLEPFFFGILEGTVAVTVHSRPDKDVYVCSLGPSEVFGEAGLFMKVRRTASVSASGRVVLVRLHRQDFAAMIRERPSAANKVLLVVIFSLLRKLRAANQELAFERRDDCEQADVDAMVESLMGG